MYSKKKQTCIDYINIYQLKYLYNTHCIPTFSAPVYIIKFELDKQNYCKETERVYLRLFENINEK